MEKVNEMTTSRKIVFVCLHGAAKSVIAAAFLNRLADERGLDARATAAGIEPDAEVPSAVREGLLRDGLDVGLLRPRRVTRDDLSSAWRIVSFGCDLRDVAPPGRAVERWDDVPLVSDGFPAARDAIAERVRRLLDDCG
jgi:arsenate reductase (thioredoxin)